MERFNKCDFSEEIFISRVARYPELYSLSHPEFKNFPRRQKSWAEIAASFNGDIDGDLLSKRWRLLRDSYLRCKRESVNGRPSSKHARKKRKIWKHFTAMTFIDDYENADNVVNSELFEGGHEGSLTCCVTSVATRLDDLESPIESSFLFMPPQLKTEPNEIFTDSHSTEFIGLPSRHSPASNSPRSSPTARRLHDKREDSCNALNKTIPNSFLEPEDEDTLFVKCLIPYFKKLPLEEKLEFKIKIMQLLLEATKRNSSREQSAANCDHCKTKPTSIEITPTVNAPHTNSASRTRSSKHLT